MQKKILKLVFRSFLLFFIFSQNISFGQITTDGDFSDWTTNGTTIGTNGGMTVKVFDAGDSLHIYLSHSNNIIFPRLFINSDGVTTTGYNEQQWTADGQGADILIEGAFAYSHSATPPSQGWGWTLEQSNIPYVVSADYTQIEMSIYIYDFPFVENISLGAYVETGTAGSFTYVPAGGFVNPLAPYTMQQTINYPLPIELLSFRGESRNDFSNQLTWVTATETDNEYFSIEGSKDGLSWTTLDKVESFGDGNSTTTQSYSWLDKTPAKECYYRLKQVDFSGEFSFSSIIFIKNYNNILDNEITISPNPTSGVTTVFFNGVNVIDDIRIYNQIGQDLTANVSFESLSEESVNLNFSTFQNGLYYVRISDSTRAIQVIK